jgi:polyisoprenyl-teichoic acid--peptidoglycan teichoic acid transferase
MSDRRDEGPLFEPDQEGGGEGPAAPWDQDLEDAEAREAEEPTEDRESREDEQFVEGEEAFEDGPEAEEPVEAEEYPDTDEPSEDDEYREDEEFVEGEDAAEEQMASEEEPSPSEQPAEPGGERPIPVTAQDTVEADVLALGDEEEARERGDRDTAPAETAQAPAGAAQAPAAAAPPATPAAAVAEAAGEEGDEPSTPRLWARFLAASLVIVVSMAAATSVSLLLYLSDIAKGLGGLKGVQSRLASVEGGSPQTILILGSDKRATGDHPQGLSDTTMLLRLDPDQNAIAVLSLPRDLQVNIPGRGVARLNEAYTIGGPKLTLRVVQQLTDLEINHLVNVNFVGFAKAVNAIGCVYVDVDRHYFHSNVGLAPSQQYAEINIPSGYQRLCGYQALQYVRYRHTDNDLVRAARQQDFMREARQKVPPSKLIRERSSLIKIFTRYTTSDIEDPETVLEVLKTFLSVRDAPVKQIHFKGTLGKTYITASQSEIRTAVRQFLGVQATPGPRAPTGPGGGDGGKGGKAKPKPKPAPAPLIDATAAGRQFATAADNKLGFPVFYPTKIAPASQIDDESRPAYKIVSPDGSRKYPAYKMVITRPSPSVVTEYYGVEGTAWADPPILDNPTQTKEIGNRDYLQFFDGERLRLVGWKTDQGSYWVSNTLGQTLSAPQMMGIAQSMRPFSPGQ